MQMTTVIQLWVADVHLGRNVGGGIVTLYNYIVTHKTVTPFYHSCRQPVYLDPWQGMNILLLLVLCFNLTLFAFNCLQDSAFPFLFGSSLSSPFPSLPISLSNAHPLGLEEA